MLAVRLAGEGERAAAPHLPRGHDGRGVFVGCDEREVRLGLQVGEVVAAERGRLPVALPAERAEAAGDFERRAVFDERAARDGERVLRKDARELLGRVAEVDLPATARRDVLEQVRIHVGFRAHADDADGDAGLADLCEQVDVLARLLGIGGIGEEDDVLRLGLGLHDHLGRGGERLVDEDAATHALDAEDAAALAAHGVDGRKVHHRVRGRVHGDDA